VVLAYFMDFMAEQHHSVKACNECVMCIGLLIEVFPMSRMFLGAALGD
jgi:hypothetical protein